MLYVGNQRQGAPVFIPWSTAHSVAELEIYGGNLLRKSLATVRDIPLDVPMADSGERCPHLPQLHTYF